ncbi:MAG TPA: hypothetical protein VGJ05_09725 [Fimbriiglobus sp.]|jgi:hypothetical protein
MTQEVMDFVPLWLWFVILCIVTGLALEFGYRFGKQRRARTEGEKEAPVGAIVGSILGLFAFMLAFTFGMAGSRYEDRRKAVLEEANAIGTTYYRTSLLPEPQRTASAKLLREYVNVRVQGVEEGKPAVAIARSKEIHDDLWNQATAALENNKAPLGDFYYILSLNSMIEMHTRRVQAGLFSRIPLTIWMGILVLSVVAMSAVGYQSGLSQTRRSPTMVGLLFSFAGVMILIADFDRGHAGTHGVSQQAMTDLRATMNPKN